jgi:hypothetical protein
VFDSRVVRSPFCGRVVVVVVVSVVAPSSGHADERLNHIRSKTEEEDRRTSVDCSIFLLFVKAQ